LATMRLTPKHAAVRELHTAVFRFPELVCRVRRFELLVVYITISVPRLSPGLLHEHRRVRR
jgi:hypothetical protein